MENAFSGPLNRVFSPPEAAAVNDVAVKVVHNAIDKRIVSSRTSGRRELTIDDLLRLKIWHGMGSSLSPERRRFLFEEIARRPDAPTVRLDEFLIVDLQTARAALMTRIDELEAAEAAVEKAPGVAGGEPVFRGTRVPVRAIAAMLAEGVGASEILEGYPALDERALALAPIWSIANPLRGRPKILADEGLPVKDERRVPFQPSGSTASRASDA